MTVIIKTYVAGFCLNRDQTRIILVKKNRPDWQAGRFNAVGGKIEEYDLNPAAAMQRECREETGIDIAADVWREKVILTRPGFYHVHFFIAVIDDALFDQARTIEDEEIHKIGITEIGALPLIDNLRWIIPLCRDDNIAEPVKVLEKP